MTVVAVARAALDRMWATQPFDTLGIATSGGGDSMALLRIASAWARDRGIGAAAATVDHGLRPDSAGEARSVAERSAQLGVPHEVLRWRGWNGRGNLQDAARAARRRLIAQWARGHGISAVALGHTLDDQAETVLLRLARGSGVDGLSGMRDDVSSGGARWLRPLLQTGRRDLRGYLRDDGIGWIDDPSNEDPAFDRVKARHALQVLHPIGIEAAGLARTAVRLQLARDALQRLASIAAAEVARVAAGDVVFDVDRLQRWPFETRFRLVADAVRWVTGATYRPRLAALQEALESGATRTLAGTLLVRRAGTLRVTREYRAVAGLTAGPGEVWDGRWIVAGPAQARDVVTALGDAVTDCPGWRDESLPIASLRASPAVWRDGALVAAPLAALGEGWSARLAPGRDDFSSFLISR